MNGNTARSIKHAVMRRQHSRQPTVEGGHSLHARALGVHKVPSPIQLSYQKN